MLGLSFLLLLYSRELGTVLPTLRVVLPSLVSESAVLDTGRAEVRLLREARSNQVDNEDKRFQTHTLCGDLGAN